MHTVLVYFYVRELTPRSTVPRGTEYAIFLTKCRATVVTHGRALSNIFLCHVYSHIAIFHSYKLVCSRVALGAPVQAVYLAFDFGAAEPDTRQ